MRALDARNFAQQFAAILVDYAILTREMNAMIGQVEDDEFWLRP